MPLRLHNEHVVAPASTISSQLLLPKEKTTKLKHNQHNEASKAAAIQKKLDEFLLASFLPHPRWKHSKSSLKDSKSKVSKEHSKAQEKVPASQDSRPSSGDTHNHGLIHYFPRRLSELSQHHSSHAPSNSISSTAGASVAPRRMSHGEPAYTSEATQSDFIPAKGTQSHGPNTPKIQQTDNFDTSLKTHKSITSRTPNISQLRQSPMPARDNDPIDGSINNQELPPKSSNLDSYQPKLAPYISSLTSNNGPHIAGTSSNGFSENLAKQLSNSSRFTSPLRHSSLPENTYLGPKQVSPVLATTATSPPLLVSSKRTSDVKRALPVMPAVSAFPPQEKIRSELQAIPSFTSPRDSPFQEDDINAVVSHSTQQNALLPSPVINGKPPDLTERSKHAANLATRFINFRLANSPPTIQQVSQLASPTSPTSHKPHIPDQPTVTSGSVLETQILSNFERNVTPSRETLLRAQRARANLEFRYDIITNYRENLLEAAGASTNPENQVRPNESSEDGDDFSNETLFEWAHAYNPLQTIRNRKVRPHLGTSTSSKHSHHLLQKEKHPNQCFWTVDLPELVIDLAWQAQNSIVRRRSDGRLSFSKGPNTDPVENDGRSSLSAHDDHKLHRYNTRGQASVHASLTAHLNKLKQNLTGSSRAGTPPSSQPYTPPELVVSPYLEDTKLEPGFEQVESGLKDRGLNTNNFSSNISDEARLSVSDIPFQNIRKNKSGSSDGNTNNNSSSVTDGSDLKNDQPRSQIGNTSLPIVILNGGEGLIEDLENGSNSSLSRNGASTTPTSLDAQGARILDDASSQTFSAPVDHIETKHYYNELKKLELVSFLRDFNSINKQDSCYYTNDYCHADERTKQAKEISRELNTAIQTAKRDIFPRVITGIAQTNSHITTFKVTKISTTATRIDKLVTDSDQTINRVSTTLNLEIKQLSERLVALERGSSPWEYQFAWSHLGYRVLEYLVIAILWVVWGLVSILTSARGAVVFLFKAIKWLLWC